MKSPTSILDGAGLRVAGPSSQAHSTHRDSEVGSAVLFLVLPMLFYGFAVIYPALTTLRLSFLKWDGLGDSSWVGLQNFVDLFTSDANFLRAFRNTAIWTALFVPLSTALGLVIAAILNSDIPARTFFRVMFYLPFVLSNVAVGLIWKWMYYPDIGVLDILFSTLGLPQVGWLSEPNVALYAVVAAAIWQAVGGAMVIFMAGLQTIPAELYEAAKLDGATTPQMFRHITLPGLRESIIVATSLATLGSLNVFDIVYATTQGGPANTTQVLATWMYMQTFVFGKFGVGAAIAVILVALVAVIAVPFVMRVARAQMAELAAARAQTHGDQLGAGAGRTLRFALLLVLTVVWVSPLIVVVFGALKSTDDFFQVNGLIIPPIHPDFSNFASAWTDGNLGHYMLNSLIITAIKVPLGVFVTSLAAFAITRLRWRYANAVLVVLLMGMVMPVQAALIPLQSLLSKLGLLNNYASLIAIYIGFGIPFGTLILRGFLLTIPSALDEAAMIDGASAWQRFSLVIMPLAWPALASLMIFDSLFTFNEFIFAQLLITDDNLRPAQAGLLAFSGSYQQQFGALNAGILITIAPAVLVYLIFQRRFVTGLAGAVRS